MKEGDIIEGGFWDGAEVISVYTRAQAIDDGVLADVSEVAREAGFTIPVAVTSAVWNLIEPTQDEESYGQSASGRLWDVLFMLHWAIKRAQANADEVRYEVIFNMRGRSGYRTGQHTLELKALCGPGDNAEPVITIMLPNED